MQLLPSSNNAPQGWWWGSPLPLFLFYVDGATIVRFDGTGHFKFPTLTYTPTPAMKSCSTAQQSCCAHSYARHTSCSSRPRPRVVLAGASPAQHSSSSSNIVGSLCNCISVTQQRADKQPPGCCVQPYTVWEPTGAYCGLASSSNSSSETCQPGTGAVPAAAPITWSTAALTSDLHLLPFVLSLCYALTAAPLCSSPAAAGGTRSSSNSGSGRATNAVVPKTHHAAPAQTGLPCCNAQGAGGAARAVRV